MSVKAVDIYLAAWRLGKYPPLFTSSSVNNCSFSSFSLSTTWPSNSCQQALGCSCVVRSKNVLLQISFYSHRTLVWKMADRFLELSESDRLNMKKIDRLIKQLLISVIAKYCDFSVSCGTIIFLSFRLRQINDLLTNEIRQITIFCPTSCNNCSLSEARRMGNKTRFEM